MASLEYIKFDSYRLAITEGEVAFEPTLGGKTIDGLPQVFWHDGSPWIEVCLWARERAASRLTDIKTVQSNMRHLHAFANFLEKIEADWRHFPQRKENRVLVRWRGALIEANRNGELASSTIAQRMNATINFYRYALENGLVERHSPLWQDRPQIVRYFDSVGFSRTLTVDFHRNLTHLEQ